MSKKRIIVAIVLNFILFLALTRFIIIRIYGNSTQILDEIVYADVVVSILLWVIEVIYLLALFHSLIANKKIANIIDALRLIFISAILTIMVVRLCLVLPYSKTYDIYGVDIYSYMALPVLSLISILVIKKKYSAFGLLYANIGVIGYIGAILALIALGKIEAPYKFLDIMNQQVYKSVINIVIIIAINTVIAGLIMLLTRHKSVEMN